MNLIIAAAGYGTRIQSITKGKPKQFLKIKQKTLIQYYIELAKFLNIEPIIITNPTFKKDFRKTRVKILIEEKPKNFMTTLYYAKRIADDNFCYILGDMYFSQFGPLKKLLKNHLKDNYLSSYLYVKNSAFKTKLRFKPKIKLKISWGKNENYPYSLPNFFIQNKKIFEYMKIPRKNFANRTVKAKEKINFLEYKAITKEIDTPKDLINLNNKLNEIRHYHR